LLQRRLGRGGEACTRGGHCGALSRRLTNRGAMFAIAANTASVAAAAAAPRARGGAAAAPRAVSIQSHGGARRSGGVSLSRRGGAGAAGHSMRMVRTAAADAAGKLTTLCPS
jgi:hypothetical protein